jgi:hypothetical protein
MESRHRIHPGGGFLLHPAGRIGTDEARRFTPGGFCFAFAAMVNIAQLLGTKFSRHLRKTARRETGPSSCVAALAMEARQVR